jgi:hypothetical protein
VRRHLTASAATDHPAAQSGTDQLGQGEQYRRNDDVQARRRILPHAAVARLVAIAPAIDGQCSLSQWWLSMNRAAIL